MALIECAECKKQISDQADACPGCGARRPKEAKSYAWLWTLLILFADFIWYSSVVRGKDPQVAQMRQDRAAYELCLQTLKENPGNPIARGACVQMRTKFVAKYNREP